MGSGPLTFRIQADPPPRLDKALSRDVPEESALSRTRLVRLIADGLVQVNGMIICNQKHRVHEDDEVAITIPEARESHIMAEDIPLDILFEDDDLVVINKPAGMVVHPAPGSPDGTLVNALLGHFGDGLSSVGDTKRPGIVHRIDKDTSGLLMVAKSDLAHQRLAEQFEKHTVKRVYTALAYGIPDIADPRLRGVKGVGCESGGVIRVTTRLARHRTDRQRQAVTFAGGRHAVTRLRVRHSYGMPPSVALVECWLETGRTHQIRVHMAHIGHGLIGDPVYGGRRKLRSSALSDSAYKAIAGFSRQALHAGVLGFVHPVSGSEMEFQTPLPNDFQHLLTLLGDDHG